MSLYLSDKFRHDYLKDRLRFEETHEEILKGLETKDVADIQEFQNFDNVIGEIRPYIPL